MKSLQRILIVAALSCIPAASAENPTPNRALQDQFLEWQFGMFIHFNMATFHDVEWVNGYEDPATFQPAKLDAEQWAEAAVAAGMRYAVLTVKHTGGWCLWDSQLTKTHAMSAFLNYENGEGDIVREFVDACRKHGLKAGFYYCFPRDFGHPEDKETRRGLPPEGAQDPLGFVKAQLSELLTRYGPIDLLWCDQYQFDLKEDWPEIMAHVKSLQPDCVIVANNSRDFAKTDIHSFEYPWLLAKGRDPLPATDNTIPSEVCDKMESSWFWKSEDDWKIADAETIVKMLRLSNERKANYLLNVAPDRTGLIPAASVERLREVGAILRATGR